MSGKKETSARLIITSEACRWCAFRKLRSLFRDLSPWDCCLRHETWRMLLIFSDLSHGTRGYRDVFQGVGRKGNLHDVRGKSPQACMDHHQGFPHVLLKSELKTLLTLSCHGERMEDVQEHVTLIIRSATHPHELSWGKSWRFCQLSLSRCS